MSTKDEIRAIADKYKSRLKQRIDDRIKEMKQDDTSHFLIYQVLGITNDEGMKIDVYQNKGRFLYRYAGSFLEEVTVHCFTKTFPDAKPLRIENTVSSRPKKFQIDCVIGQEAIEIKWRDATTDGDHIAKEHARIKATSEKGLTPIRVMFYYPNRQQSIRIQQTLETLYKGIGGYYYYGDSAWNYVHDKTGINLKTILEEIVLENNG